MVRHIVMFKLKDFSEEEKHQKASQLKHEIESMKTRIPQVEFIEAGINFNAKPGAYDVILISEFKNEDDLNVYRNHPEHEKVLDFIHSITEKTAIVDYYGG